MKITFLGYAVPRELENYFDGLSVAGNKMQTGIIHALKEYGCDISVISVPPLIPYPYGRALHSKRRWATDHSGIRYLLITFINLPIVKQFHQTISVFIELLKNTKKGEILLTFNAFPQIGVPASLVQKIRSLIFIPLLADLPIDDLEGRRGISKLLRRAFDYLTEWSILNSNRLIVLSDAAANEYAPKLPSLCIEGGVDSAETQRYCSVKKTRKNVVYTGALTAYSGIREAINAMQYVKSPDIILEIYGAGPLEEEIKSLIRGCNNVLLHGRISHNEILEIQSDAWLLINPRLLLDPISTMTFPSKIFEYMLSSTPVLTTKMKSFSERYSDLLYHCESSDPLHIAKRIDEIAELQESELRNTACRAFLYVAENKTWQAQAGRIVEFIKK